MKLIFKITLLLITLCLSQVISIRLQGGPPPKFKGAAKWEKELIDPFFPHDKSIKFKHKALGNGAYGIAYLVTLYKLKTKTEKKRKANGEIFYVHDTKKNDIDKYVIKKTAIRGTQREREIMKILRKCSIGVVNLIDFKRTDHLNFFKLEFCEGGDLQQRLKTPSPYRQNGLPDREDERTLAHKFLSAIKGLRCLHKNEILHRDLKPDNIFICNDQFKIADYGLSTPPQIEVVNRDQYGNNILGRRKNSLFSNNGNPNYHQDMWRNKKYYKGVDVYAMHATFMEVHTKNNFGTYASINDLFYGRASFGYISSNLDMLTKCVFKADSSQIMTVDDYYGYMKRLSQGKNINCY